MDSWIDQKVRYDFGIFDNEEDAMIKVNDYCSKNNELIKNYKIVETKLIFGKMFKVHPGKMKFVFD